MKLFSCLFPIVWTVKCKQEVNNYKFFVHFSNGTVLQWNLLICISQKTLRNRDVRLRLQNHRNCYFVSRSHSIGFTKEIKIPHSFIKSWFHCKKMNLFEAVILKLILNYTVLFLHYLRFFLSSFVTIQSFCLSLQNKALLTVNTFNSIFN